MAGRPTKYKPEYNNQAYKLCLLSATDKALANFFETSEVTINAWKKAYPSFLKALKDGKEKADSEVAKSLFHRACGYSHPEDKIFCTDGKVTTVKTTKHYPPDTAAAFIWLKNRAGWRDKQVIVNEGPAEAVEESEQEATDAACKVYKLKLAGSA